MHWFQNDAFNVMCFYIQGREILSEAQKKESFPFRCYDTVGWATGRASGLQKAGCWFAGGDDVDWNLHILQLQLSLPSSVIQQGWQVSAMHGLKLTVPAETGFCQFCRKNLY